MVIDEFLMSVGYPSRQIGGRLIKASVIGRNARVDAEVCKPRIELRNRSDEFDGCLYGDRAKAGALCRDIVSVLVARERRMPLLEACSQLLIRTAVLTWRWPCV
jgi:hypothetical protein